jgi:hypothetical protein
MRQSETDIIVLQSAVSDQDRVAESALPQQMHLVFARSEIDRRKVSRRDFAIHRHGESGDDERPLTLLFHEKENAQRRTPNVQRPTV